MLIILCGKGYVLSGMELLEALHNDIGEVDVPVHAVLIRDKPESLSYIESLYGSSHHFSCCCNCHNFYSPFS